MDKVKINLFGESWSLKHVELKDSIQSQILSKANSLSRDLSSLLLDSDFYEQLNVSGIESISDLPGKSIKGLLNNSKSQLEIWLNGKKVIKIKIADIYHQQTLFKLYDTKKDLIDFEKLVDGIYVFEQEMGLIASYKFTCEKFTINKLSFGLIQIQHEGKVLEILKDIFFENVFIKSKFSDTVLISSSCQLKSFDNQPPC